MAHEGDPNYDPNYTEWLDIQFKAAEACALSRLKSAGQEAIAAVEVVDGALHDDKAALSQWRPFAWLGRWRFQFPIAVRLHWPMARTNPWGY